MYRHNIRDLSLIDDYAVMSPVLNNILIEFKDVDLGQKTTRGLRRIAHFDLVELSCRG